MNYQRQRSNSMALELVGSVYAPVRVMIFQWKETV
jgi:hypothetical protein